MLDWRRGAQRDPTDFPSTTARDHAGAPRPRAGSDRPCMGTLGRRCHALCEQVDRRRGPSPDPAVPLFSERKLRYKNSGLLTSRHANANGARPSSYSIALPERAAAFPKHHTRDK